MTKVFCYEKGCIHNNNKEEICKSERIATGKLINKNNGKDYVICISRKVK